MSDLTTTFIFIIVIAVFVGISFSITGLIVKGICWAFGFVFSWKIAFGVWLVLILLGGITGSVKVNRG